MTQHSDSRVVTELPGNKVLDISGCDWSTLLINGALCHEHDIQSLPDSALLKSMQCRAVLSEEILFHRKQKHTEHIAFV